MWLRLETARLFCNVDVQRGCGRESDLPFPVNRDEMERKRISDDSGTYQKIDSLRHIDRTGAEGGLDLYNQQAS